MSSAAVSAASKLFLIKSCFLCPKVLCFCLHAKCTVMEATKRQLLRSQPGYVPWYAFQDFEVLLLIVHDGTSNRTAALPPRGGLSLSLARSLRGRRLPPQANILEYIFFSLAISLA